MATQVTLNSGSVDSAGSLALKTNGTTTAVTINASQGVEFNAGAVGTPSITTTGDTNTGIFFPAADTIAFSEGGVESMRIDSSGNVGIGSTTSNGKLTLKNPSSGSEQVMLAIQAASSTSAIGRITYDQTVDTLRFTNMSSFSGSSIRFGNNGLDQVMIDLSGNLLVGTTTAGGAGFTLADAKYIWSLGTYNNASAGGANMVVASNGSFARSTSALKYKQDIRDLEKIDINVFRAVRYKSKCEIDDQTVDRFGLIADEVDQAGITELVSYGATGEIEGFLYERFTVVLLKAIQEQQAIITQLQADVAALKGTA